jgi:uncharacterized protein (TIGR02246 family)
MTNSVLRPALLAGALSLAALVGCAKTTVDAAKPAPDTAAVEKALRDTETAWNTENKAKDLAKIQAHYAPDAVLMTPGAAAVSGKPAVDKAMQELVADPAFDLSFTADKVGVSEAGDMGYTRGSFKLTVTDPATKKPVTQTGSYLTVYKKQADGSWRAVEDIASPGATSPAKPG